jgi:Phage tail sheath C-terminal domain
MVTTLTSPGVDISVTDESFYATSGSGTIPLIIIGTHEYKIGPDGSSIAEGTLPENANKLYLVTSQRELVQTFGNPVFYQTNGTSRHGFELNEYGLHAAYSYLGIANQAYVVRGDIDYSELFASSSQPVGEPTSGTYWLDTSVSTWGIHEGIDSTTPGSAWTAETPIIVDEASEVEHRVIGSVSFTSVTDVVASASGNININGTAVSIASGDTLQSIINKINSASITGITASVFQLQSKSRILIRNTTTNGSVEIGNTSTVAILASLGLDGTEEDTYGPKNSLGTVGSYAMVLTSNNDNEVFVKLAASGIEYSTDPLSTNFWFKVGSDNWKKAQATRITGTNLGSAAIPALNGTTLTINTSSTVASAIDVTFTGTTLTVTDVANAITTALNAMVADANKGTTANAITAYAQSGSVVLVNKNGGDIILNSSDTAATALGLKTKFGVKLRFSPHYTIPKRVDDLGRSVVVAGEVWITTTQYNDGANWVVKYYNGDTGVWSIVTSPLLADDSAANTLFGSDLSIGTLYVKYNVNGDSTNQDASHEIRRWNGTIWEALVYSYGSTAPTTNPEEGTLWFNDNFQVDIMINDGDQWLGYKNYAGNVNTSANGVILAGSTPTYQQDGSALAHNDLWINTSDTENYPLLYRYDSASLSWTLIDNTDQYTAFGIVFADARATSDGTVNGPTDQASLLVSNYLDPDAPDPRLYPEGMLLFNTRYATNNVKEWRPSYFAGEYESTNYTLAEYNVGYTTFPALAAEDVGRWVTTSGLEEDGSPKMGRKAQRALIVRALQATISSNEDIRAESIYFNLLAAPGYIELIDEMVTLNTDKKQTAFIVADTPIRLKATATELAKFANVDQSGATTNSETGIVTFDPYVGVYYPWGLGTNYDGYDIMIPPSTMALRTIAYSDSVAYPWYAPAGSNRGIVTNATNVGYLTDEDEFKSVLLNAGLRDVLYENNINPIAYIPGRGLLIYGQKTRNSDATALDRINVARLINYLRYNLDVISVPFLFEQHTYHTRDSIKATFDSYLATLVNLDALADFIVVCDTTNNTDDRIDANELWVDIAIVPVKAIEFIYIPIRIMNTGDDLSSLYDTTSTL